MVQAAEEAPPVRGRRFRRPGGRRRGAPRRPRPRGEERGDEGPAAEPAAGGQRPEIDLEAEDRIGQGADAEQGGHQEAEGRRGEGERHGAAAPHVAGPSTGPTKR